jgi:hypothetical protein
MQLQEVASLLAVAALALLLLWLLLVANPATHSGTD